MISNHHNSALGDYICCELQIQIQEHFMVPVPAIGGALDIEWPIDEFLDDDHITTTFGRPKASGSYCDRDALVEESKAATVFERGTLPRRSKKSDNGEFTKSTVTLMPSVVPPRGNAANHSIDDLIRDSIANFDTVTADVVIRTSLELG